MWLTWIIPFVLLVAFIVLMVVMCREYKGCPGCRELRRHRDEETASAKKRSWPETAAGRSTKDQKNDPNAAANERCRAWSERGK